MSAGIQIPDKLLARKIPKHGLTKEEVIFAYGSTKLVRDLVRVGKLKGKKSGATVLFDALHIEQVWKQWMKNEFDHLLN